MFSENMMNQEIIITKEISNFSCFRPIAEEAVL